ncbi:hypothetical protein BJ138DRAFT_879992 [Hygrophoropsis aurantiaca]|uniref:Uncharacterized protein n=1 Tax=Hygrophoropsis aurantiaca TaxID=72124 RepID=A0ACB8AQP0_9AGAM|nr:hypothetical protein BJ138DRAFT_879992 [Hygrophoropsis aurantiaca]
MSTISPDVLVSLLHIKTVKYCRLAPAALWIYEYCLTFNDEFRFVWCQRPNSSRGNIIQACFVILRYLPIATSICAIYGALMTSLIITEPN